MRLANGGVISAPERLTACLHVTLPMNVAVTEEPFFPCGCIASITGDLG
jgi:hypothetical protein